VSTLAAYTKFNDFGLLLGPDSSHAASAIVVDGIVRKVAAVKDTENAT